MSDTSPNSLEPIKKVNAARMSKWPLYAVLLAGLFPLGILVCSVNFAHNQEEEQDGTPKVDIKEEEKPLIVVQSDKGQPVTAPVLSIGSSSAADKPSISMPDASGLRENGYDPAADKDKEAFFDRAGKKIKRSATTQLFPQHGLSSC